MSRIRRPARIRTIWTLSLMAAGLGAAPVLAAPVEQRCSELGSACLCSEPLRFTSAGRLVEMVDPPDSEGAGAKECAGGSAIDAEPSGMQLVDRVDNASNTDFPGPNPPAFVLKMTSVANDADNGWQVRGNQPTGVQNETICSRDYQRFGNDLPIAVEPMRIKMSESVLNGRLNQDGIVMNGRGQFDVHDGDCTGTNNIQMAGRQSWIRHETCMDVGSSSYTIRARVVVIETGVTDTITCGPHPLSTPASYSEFLIGNLHLQTAGNSAYFGSRYFTHAIQTRLPLDSTFWPGPARELEVAGGTSTPPPTTPPPTTPPPTEPLGKPGQPIYTP